MKSETVMEIKRAATWAAPVYRLTAYFGCADCSGVGGVWLVGGVPLGVLGLALVGTDPRVARIVKDFKPSVILISGCQDNQTSLDGDHNGAFTEQLLKVWSTGAFKGDYVKFHGTITAGMPSSQTPNLFPLGDAATFLQQRPFTV